MLDLDDGLRMIDVAAAEYFSVGVTTAQNGHARGDMLELLEAAAARNRLPIRLVVWPQWEEALRIAKGERRFNAAGNPRLLRGAAKIFADGSIQGYTGYLSAPYRTPFNGDAAYRGYPIYPPERLAEIVETLQGAGLQIAIHGNGDAAIDDILGAFRRAQQTAPRADTRHLVVHAQMSRPDQLDEMARLGVSPSFFSLHTYYWGERHRDIFIGPERAMAISPARSAAERGLRYSIHCDTPVVPMTPLLLAWAAVNRVSAEGSRIGPEERITALAALRALTIEPAWQAFQEAEIGSIEVGKQADFTILSGNPLAEPETIRDLKVMETLLGGETVFQA